LLSQNATNSYFLQWNITAITGVARNFDWGMEGPK